MKGTKANVVGEQNAIPEYEQQRLERLRRNAEFMDSKGCGSLANKIYEERASNWFSYAGVEDDYLEDPKEFAQESEGETSVKVSKQSKPRCMADFLKQQVGKQQQQQNQQNHQMQKQHQQQPNQQRQMQKEQQPNQPSQMQKQQQPNQPIQMQKHQPIQMQKQQQPSKTQKQPQQGQMQKQQQSQVQRHQQPSEMQKQQQSQSQMQRQQRISQMQKRKQVVENAITQKDGHSQQLQFCSPGSLAAYYNVRKQQVISTKNVAAVENEQEFEVQLTSPNTDESPLVEGAVENELHAQLETEKGNNVAPETESQCMIESSNEGPKPKNHRGPTKLTSIHARTKDQRTPIVLNSYGQPIGPTKKDAEEFSRFLGTVARNTDLAPLNYIDWRGLPTHDQIWEYVLEKYMVPSEGRRWVMETIDEIWRGHKSRLKSKYFLALRTNDSKKMDEVREAVPENQLNDLIDYWSYSPIKEQSEKNKRNRSMLDDLHTMGPSSYALLRHQLQQADPNKQEPSKSKVYREARKRNSNKKYKTSYENIKANIEQMEALESQEHEEGSKSKDPYCEVIKKPEHSGRIRLYGKGVTKTKLNDGGNKPSFVFPQEFLQSIQRQVEEKLQAANPGRDLVIPEFFDGVTSGISSKHQAPQANEPCGREVNVVIDSSNQEEGEETRLEVEDT